jgi:hypothetical protein
MNFVLFPLFVFIMGISNNVEAQEVSEEPPVITEN